MIIVAGVDQQCWNESYVEVGVSRGTAGPEAEAPPVPIY